VYVYKCIHIYIYMYIDMYSKSFINMYVYIHIYKDVATARAVALEAIRWLRLVGSINLYVSFAK